MLKLLVSLSLPATAILAAALAQLGLTHFPFAPTQPRRHNFYVSGQSHDATVNPEELCAGPPHCA